MTVYPIITDASKSDLSILARAIDVTDKENCKSRQSKSIQSSFNQIITTAGDANQFHISAEKNMIGSFPASLRAVNLMLYLPSFFSPIDYLTTFALSGIYRTNIATNKTEKYLNEDLLASMLSGKTKLAGGTASALDTIPSGFEMIDVDDQLKSHSSLLDKLEG